VTSAIHVDIIEHNKECHSFQLLQQPEDVVYHCHLTVLANALCFGAVCRPLSFIRTDLISYHGISWTAWAASMKLTWIFTSPYRWPD